MVTKEPGESREDYNKRQRKAHREAYPMVYKSHNLRRSFGPDFGFDAYMAMAEAQDFKCAVCGETERATKNGMPIALAVDHDHKTGRVRGLCCMDCNTGLGKFRDDVDLLHKAIAYLTKHG